MKKQNMNENGCGRQVEKMPLVEMKDTLDNGGRVTLLIRHAERPPLNPGDFTFGASLSLTENGWRRARDFGLMLANNLLPMSVAFYASETFRTMQTACAMAMGLDLVGTGQSIERKVRLAPFLGSESPFFGSVEKRMELAASGNCRDRLNDYFRTGKQYGFKRLRHAAKKMERHLNALHDDGWPLVVAVTHDINVAALLAARGVVESFTEETWPDYLEAAAVITKADGEVKYVYFRWNQDMGAISLTECPSESECLKREDDDDLTPVITFEPAKEPFRIVTPDEMSEKDAQRMHLPIQVGRAADGETVCADLVTLPHLIVAGATGQGKTVFLNSVIYRFLTRWTPDEVRLVVGDPKLVEYTALADSPFLAAPVIHDIREFVSTLRWINREMERRLNLFCRKLCRNIQEYNGRKVAGEMGIGGNIPYLVVLVDEMADYMALSRKRVEPLISRVSAKGRAAGIHFIIATQQPNRACLTNLLKANIPGRIAFKMAQPADSRHVIEKNGAENLNGCGDLLFRAGDPFPIRRAQCAYVSDDKFLEACEAAVDKYGRAKKGHLLPHSMRQGNY